MGDGKRWMRGSGGAGTGRSEATAWRMGRPM